MRRRTTNVLVLSAFLLLWWPTSTQALEPRLSRDEIDSLLGSQGSFERDEVAELLSAVVAMADEEIARTSEEAVKAAALKMGPEIARERALAEEWQSEAARLSREGTTLKAVTIAEACVIGVLALAFCVREATR